MTTLADHQFEILPSVDAEDGFVFGIGAEVSIDGDGGFDPGELEWVGEATQNTRRGVRGFGRDVPGAKTWIWSSHTDKQTEAEALTVLEDFSAAWMPEELVREPSALTALRYHLVGRTRRIFGRPKRFAAPPSNLILGGYVPITHDFELVDSFTYDDLESSVEIPYSTSAAGGGFILPAPMPLTTLPSEGVGGGQAAVGGNAKAYPIVRFNGPWINPSLDTGAWKLEWTGSVPVGDHVEIDCRPWALTVLNASGASVVEGLGRRTWLEDCWFAAKSQPQFSLGGSAPGGGASATIRWRNTWTSI